MFCIVCSCFLLVDWCWPLMGCVACFVFYYCGRLLCVALCCFVVFVVGVVCWLFVVVVRSLCVCVCSVLVFVCGLLLLLDIACCVLLLFVVCCR